LFSEFFLSIIIPSIRDFSLFTFHYSLFIFHF
jgi:hypothetical protein